MGPEPAWTASKSPLPLTSPYCLDAVLPPIARLLHASKRDPKGIPEVVVDKSHAHIDLCAHAERELLVARVNGTGQPPSRFIDDRDGLLLAVKLAYRHDRAKDLLARNAHSARDVRERNEIKLVKSPSCQQLTEVTAIINCKTGGNKYSATKPCRLS